MINIQPLLISFHHTAIFIPCLPVNLYFTFSDQYSHSICEQIILHELSKIYKMFKLSKMFESGIVFSNLVSFEFPASHCFQKRKDSHRSTFATTPYIDDRVI